MIFNQFKKGENALNLGDLALKLYHHVNSDLKTDLQKFQDFMHLLTEDLKEKVKELFTSTQEIRWLSPQDVHDILTSNLQDQTVNVANISPQHIHRASQITPSIRSGYHYIQFFPSVLKGDKIEGMELEPDKTLKHEFRIIVLNILHEWSNADDQDFSEMDGANFLENLIKEKLGDDYAQKIKNELDGAITFKSLLAIDKDEAVVGNEKLKKERDTFYSAQFSLGAVGQDEGGDGEGNNKVWARIKDIVDKYNSASSKTSSLDFKNSFKSALDASMYIGGLSGDNSDIIQSTILSFEDKNRNCFSQR